MRWRWLGLMLGIWGGGRRRRRRRRRGRWWRIVRGVLPCCMRARRRRESVLVFICNVQRCSLLHQGAIEWYLCVDTVWGGEWHRSVVICSRAGPGDINFWERINVGLSSSRWDQPLVDLHLPDAPTSGFIIRPIEFLLGFRSDNHIPRWWGARWLHLFARFS